MCHAERNLFVPSFAPNTQTRQHIPWNSAIGAEIFRITATDNDTGPDSSRIRYSLVPFPYPPPLGISDGLRMFTIENTSGVITVARDLRIGAHHVAPQFLLAIRASDEGEPPRHAIFTLNLIPVPTLVFEGPMGRVSINEETPLGTVVSQLSCEETGPSSFSAQIKFLNGQGPELVRLVGRSNLEVARRLDYESLSEHEREYNITATCSNRYNQTEFLTITVVINDINDAIL